MALEAYLLREEAERALLGTIIFFLPEILAEVRKQVTVSDFADSQFPGSRNGRIYQALLSFPTGTPLNQLTLAHHMDNLRLLEPADLAYMVELELSVPTPYDCQSYIDVMKPKKKKPRFTGVV